MAIKLGIFVNDKGKIYTDFSEKELTLIQASMLVYELERIKQQLLDKDWEKEIRIDEEEKNDN